MISRIWHGYTTFENTATYENLLKEEIFVGIKNREIIGFAVVPENAHMILKITTPGHSIMK
jgi:hypothetical protein